MLALWRISRLLQAPLLVAGDLVSALALANVDMQSGEAAALNGSCFVLANI
jgi:hypothetical protein